MKLKILLFFAVLNFSFAPSQTKIIDRKIEEKSLHQNQLKRNATTHFKNNFFWINKNFMNKSCFSNVKISLQKVKRSLQKAKSDVQLFLKFIEKTKSCRQKPKSCRQKPKNGLTGIFLCHPCNYI